MIDQEVLAQLVPNRFPEDEISSKDRLERLPEGPERWIGAWSAHLRSQLRAEAAKGSLSQRIEESGFVATGIFRVTYPYDVDFTSEFPVVDGLQFGALLLRGTTEREPYRSTIAMEDGRTRVLVREAVASINLNGHANKVGRIAAVYRDADGQACGITARHVVHGYQRGQRVPLDCPCCEEDARLLRSVPGLIDAASVMLSCECGYCCFRHPGHLRTAIEGETIHLHLGHQRTIPCTVMASLSTPSQIKSAAIPKHFLTEKHGLPGDSGSLISSPNPPHDPADLIGMYLGEASCEDPEGVFVNYGYALELKQVADMLGARNLRGCYHD